MKTVTKIGLGMIIVPTAFMAVVTLPKMGTTDRVQQTPLYPTGQSATGLKPVVVEHYNAPGEVLEEFFRNVTKLGEQGSPIPNPFAMVFWAGAALTAYGLVTS